MTSFSETLTADLDARLSDVDDQLAGNYPGASPARQPLHTVYIPADSFSHSAVPEWGEQALAGLDEHGSHEFFADL